MYFLRYGKFSVGYKTAADFDQILGRKISSYQRKTTKFSSNWFIYHWCFAELLPEHHIKQAITWKPLISQVNPRHGSPWHLNRYKMNLILIAAPALGYFKCFSWTSWRRLHFHIAIVKKRTSWFSYKLSQEL